MLAPRKLKHMLFIMVFRDLLQRVFFSYFFVVSWQFDEIIVLQPSVNATFKQYQNQCSVVVETAQLPQAKRHKTSMKYINQSVTTTNQ